MDCFAEKGLSTKYGTCEFLYGTAQKFPSEDFYGFRYPTIWQRRQGFSYLHGAAPQKSVKDEKPRRGAGDIPPDHVIAAILPEYTAEGDMTKVMLSDGGEMLISCSVKTALRSLAARSSKSLPLLRASAADYTCRRLNNPVAVCADLVFAFVKTRLPKVPGDPAMGGVNVAAVASCEDAEGGAKIVLKSGANIPVHWSRRTTEDHISRAMRIFSELRRKEDEAVLRRLYA